MDGTYGDFSYLKCFFTSERTEYMAECRNCIAPWIREWRRNNSIPDDYHVHHKAPATFAVIAEAFGKLTDWATPVDSLEFIRFHAERADLEGLSTEEHQVVHAKE